MDLNVVYDKNGCFELAQEYFKKMDFIELDIDFDEIIPKSISILTDHDFIPTPCIEIKLELSKDKKKVASYILYINENKEFVDEFFII